MTELERPAVRNQMEPLYRKPVIPRRTDSDASILCLPMTMIIKALALSISHILRILRGPEYKCGSRVRLAVSDGEYLI